MLLLLSRITVGFFSLQYSEQSSERNVRTLNKPLKTEFCKSYQLITLFILLTRKHQPKHCCKQHYGDGWMAESCWVGRFNDTRVRKIVRVWTALHQWISITSWSTKNGIIISKIQQKRAIFITIHSGDVIFHWRSCNSYTDAGISRLNFPLYTNLKFNQIL